MSTRLASLLLVLLAVTGSAATAHAQRGGFASRGSRLSRGRGFNVRRGERLFGGSLFLPALYSDYELAPQVIETPQPQINVVQTSEPEPASPAPRIAAQGLVLESQGNHWVRLTNNGQSQIAGQPNQESAIARESQTTDNPEKLPPAVLIFRDGHMEEIGRYTIVGTTIFMSEDYWTKGSWTRKVQIADLDVPATLAANRERSTKFAFPSGPNEVVVRP
jgi:hypothetical protein